ncbi:hypothetical protein M8J77_023255 [Diaphorina citri]|nr:hypothetical protein M8J77_023255 [Diaphorina citri]
MFLRISICSVLPILLVQANHREKRSAANIPNTSPQDQASQEVADKCFNPGPCDENAKYRTYDGSCNNLRFPMWGMTNTATVRMLPAVYSDGKKLPRKGEDGQELPKARELRQKLILDRSEPDDRRYWTLVVSWAQFISHDTGHSVPKADGISCCSKEGKILDAFSDTCMPILVSKEDKFYGKHNVSCIDMVRAKTTDDLGCPLTPVQQIIDVTHPIDASTIYGSNKTIADSLRLFQKGQLRFQTFENGQYPPNHPRPREQCDIRDNEPEVCYVAGDLRVNQNSVLTPIQIIVFRLHNQFAIKLADINPSWSDEILYQESRRIVIAIVQWITYKEFVPILIGEKLVKEADIGVASTGFETSYDLFTNPSTINEFITAAYRSLHSIIAGKIKMIGFGRKKRCADQMDDETDYTEGNEGNGEEREKEEEEEGGEDGEEEEEEGGKGEERSILSLFEKAAEKLIANKDSKERCLDKAEEDDESEEEEEEEEEKEEKSILSSIFGNKKEDE